MSDLIVHAAVLWPVLIPIFTAALTAIFWNRSRAQKAISLVSNVALLTASVLLLSTIMSDGIQSIQFGGWPAPYGISFVADQLGAAMVLVSAILSLAVGFYGRANIKDWEEKSGFYPLFHGMIAGVNGSFLTGDIFNMYVWFEIMLVAAIGLLVLRRTSPQLDGAIKYAALNIVGTIIFLIAVGLLYGATGSLNMAHLALIVPTMEPSINMSIAAVLFLAALGIKAGFFPLFFWLPASYHTASITVSAVFAGLLTKVGVYACFRIFTLIFNVEQYGIRDLVAVFAATTMVFGVLGAAIQWDIRRILSFHIISQIGYIMIGLALATPMALGGAIFYIIHHIIVKANLFLVAGAIKRATGTYDLRKTGGLVRERPLLAVLFLIPALSLAGIPLFSGFWAKLLVIDASFRSEMAWLGIVGLGVGLLTLYSMSKIWIEAFWKEPRAEVTGDFRVPKTMLVPIMALGLITLCLGIFPDPVITFARVAGLNLVNPHDYIVAVLGGAPTVGAP